nr:MAG TPA: hypothetical protein [Caudoviricetes sp.]
MSGCKAKEKPRQRGRGRYHLFFFFKICKGGAKLLRFLFCQVVFRAELVSVCASPSSIIQGGGTARNVFQHSFPLFRAFALFYSIAYRKPY